MSKSCVKCGATASKLINEWFECENGHVFLPHAETPPDLVGILNRIESSIGSLHSSVKELNETQKPMFAWMQEDPELAWAWQCSIAVCFMDEGGSHRQANEAAARFMKLAFDVDVKEFDEWKRFTSVWAEEAKRREEPLSKLTDGWVQC